MTPTASSIPIEKIKESLRATWMSGDFGVIARTISGAGADFVSQLRLPAGRVLDVACGTGNLSLPLARRGLKVTGVDIAVNLLEQARERAKLEDLDIAFDEGDAEALPYPDGSFDAVVSMFGAMFAPRPEFVARELARVLRPGGLLAMANWNMEGFSGRMFEVTHRHVQGPPGLPVPALWGDPVVVGERLSPCFQKIETERVRIDFDMPMSASEVVTMFRTYFGPTRAAFSRLDEEKQKAFADDLEQLWASANQAEDPRRRVWIENEYLKVTATRA